MIDKSNYILEEFINGEEYAIDDYYDENGTAVILNIMKHNFSSTSDVSDRLYYTSKDYIRDDCFNTLYLYNQYILNFILIIFTKEYIIVIVVRPL